MKKYFIKFNENIRLTEAQELDAIKKYKGVAKKLHDAYYSFDYDWSTKYLFGSYKKKTNTRPFSSEQDVDIIFKIPKETYDKFYKYSSGWQSSMLQEIRGILQDKYTLTDAIKARWKVVLVKFAENTHNVEILPWYEQDDWSFIIPNTESGGSRDIFNPRKEIERFNTSNKKSEWKTVILSRMIKKRVRENATLHIKSYVVENYVISFLEEFEFDEESYPLWIKSFFEYLDNNISTDNKSYVTTALTRINKAINYESNWKIEHAVEERKKVFGTSFPWTINVYKSIWETNTKLKVATEEFIESKYPVVLDETYSFVIDAYVEQDGWRKKSLSEMPRNSLKPEKKLEFHVIKNTIPQPYKIYRKIRNFWSQAEDANDLRGEITEDKWNMGKVEHTKYCGEHYIEGYVIKDWVCVAKNTLKVPINDFILWLIQNDWLDES